jgi:glycosyltransferase involved in cell wall biosynthesis
MRVQILLPTFNGERYLSQQIDSLLGQDHADTDILVRDDGSTDRTREVLAGYAGNPRVRVVFGENLGVVRSFFELLRLSARDVDYVALCDQDDVWLSDKISRALSFFTAADRTRPVAYASRVAIVDEQLRQLEMSRDPPKPLELGNSLVENLLPGCTIVLNRVARDLVVSKLPEFAFIHDWWIYLVMSACGEIRHDRESRILYRQHAQNAIGIAPNAVAKLQRRVVRFLQRRESIVRQVAEFRRLFGDQLLPAQLETVTLIEHAPHSVWSRLRLAFSGRVYRQAMLDDILLRAVILANRL